MKTIFDSTKAIAAAEANLDDYYVSAPFIVAPNETAVLILTAKESLDVDANLSFEVFRFPQPLKGEDITSCLKGVYNHLIDPQNGEFLVLGTQYTRNGSSMGRAIRYLNIDIPGNYLLYARKSRNKHITLASPTLIEVAI